MSTVADFMVAAPLAAELWQPVSHVRHLMLANSFSFIPVAPGNKRGAWRMIADYHVAQYLRGVGVSERRRRLARPVKDALASRALGFHPATTVRADAPVAEIVTRMGDHPVLVQSSRGDVVGILTAFDLL